MPLPSAQPIELVASDPFDPDTLRLRKAHDLGQAIVGARRDPNQRRALCLERFRHGVDSVDQKV
jgi:hypothetical protein